VPTARAVTAALLVAAAGIAGGCAARRAYPGPTAGTIRVRLMYREHPVPEAAVSAVRNPGVASLEERAGADTAPDGRAELILAPGDWYLFASAAEPALFSWYGSNPVQVRAGEVLEVTLPAVRAAEPATVAAVSPGDEAVLGVVTGESGPVVGAAVTLYLDASTQFRGPGYAEAQSDERGEFEARVSPGRYWLVARRRSGALAYGPLEPGDDFGFAPANPVQVRAGERVALRIPAVRVLKKSGWSGPSTLRARVAGTIRDVAGRPLAGYRAFLHAKASMLGKPEFVSEPSGPDGAYVIWVDREGLYFLGARVEIGKAREERETIGLYAGAPDHAVAVRLGAGDLTGRDVIVPVGGGAP
jgi:hypothetical protein